MELYKNGDRDKILKIILMVIILIVLAPLRVKSEEKQLG